MVLDIVRLQRFFRNSLVILSLAYRPVIINIDQILFLFLFVIRRIEERHWYTLLLGRHLIM